MALTPSSDLWKRATSLIPGGVNSPVRAMRSVGLDEPLFMRRGSGATIEDTRGNTYVDWVMSWGPLVFGHADAETLAVVAETMQRGTTFGAPTELEVELAAEIVDAVPSVEMVRLVSSGTEAAMSAVRLARAATRRDRIIKFAGCYHGHVDALLASAGSGLATLGIPSSPGVPSGVAGDTIVLPFNDVDAVAAACAQFGEGLAAILVEPVPGNMGVVPPAPGYLEVLRRLCDATGALLVFDEVITGFRVARGGAQELYGVRPDITILGKIVGGGLPAAAFGGRADLMQQLAPVGSVYQAGTLSGNPLAVAAGLSVLRRLRDPGVYAQLERTASRLAAGLEPHGVVQRVGAMMTLFCADEPIRDFEDAARSDTERYAALFRHLLAQGIYVAPSQFECLFVSTAHDDAAVDATVAAVASFAEAGGVTAEAAPADAGLFDVIAEAATRESPLWADSLLPLAERQRVAVFSPLVPDDRFALGVETIYEGYLMHFGRSRLFSNADRDTALLLGDYLFAHGLVRIAATGSVDAVSDLAELISLCAQARADGLPGDAAVWTATCALLGEGVLAGPRDALRRDRDVRPLDAAARAASGDEAVDGALAIHERLVRR